MFALKAARRFFSLRARRDDDGLAFFFKAACAGDDAPVRAARGIYMCVRMYDSARDGKTYGTC